MPTGQVNTGERGGATAEPATPALLALSSREAPDGGSDAPSPAAGEHVELAAGGDGREVAK